MRNGNLRYTGSQIIFFALLVCVATGLSSALANTSPEFYAAAEEFIGPFSSWADVKRDYGAAGDGKADDTQALQRALDDLRREDRKSYVLFLPAGVYRITQTLKLIRQSHNESKDIFNSLDWFIWHSRFEDCAVGVTNTRGAGNFHVYESRFSNSAVADLTMGNTEYFSIRNNYSIGSRAFFVAGNIGACGMITIQGNIILDPLDTPIQIGNLGPLLLFDNIIRCNRAPAVRLNPKTGLVSAGNVFTVNNPIQAKPDAIRLGDRIEQSQTVEVDRQRLPTTPSNLNRKVFELDTGADADSIQAVIDRAATLCGQRPVIHLPAGNYSINKTLKLPARCDIQLTGDGGRTSLRWTGAGAGPVLLITGPSKAVVRDLEIIGAQIADGIVALDCDQPNARVFMEQANVTGGKTAGLQVDGLENADVSVCDFNHGGNKIGVRVAGGKQAASGASVPGRVVIFSGASSNNELSYEVSDGGRLVVRDIWYESGQFPRFMSCQGSGSFTFHGGKVAVSRVGDAPALEFDDFKGDIAFLNTVFIGPELKPAPILVRGEGKQMNVLVLGALFGMGDDYFLNRSPRATVALAEPFRYTPGGGATPIDCAEKADPEFVGKMIAQTRRERPRSLELATASQTDLRFYRVLVSNCQTCILLKTE